MELAIKLDGVPPHSTAQNLQKWRNLSAKRRCAKSGAGGMMIFYIC
jgi:hypothetical protein